MSRLVRCRFPQEGQPRFPDRCIYCGRARDGSISYPVKGISSQKISGGVAGVGGTSAVWTAETSLDVPYCRQHHREATRVRSLLRTLKIVGTLLGAAIGILVPLAVCGTSHEAPWIVGIVLGLPLGALLLNDLPGGLARKIIARHYAAFADTPLFLGSFSGLLGLRIITETHQEFELEFANDEIADEFKSLNYALTH